MCAQTKQLLHSSLVTCLELRVHNLGQHGSQQMLTWKTILFPKTASPPAKYIPTCSNDIDRTFSLLLLLLEEGLSLHCDPEGTKLEQAGDGSGLGTTRWSQKQWGWVQQCLLVLLMSSRNKNRTTTDRWPSFLPKWCLQLWENLFQVTLNVGDFIYTRLNSCQCGLWYLRSRLNSQPATCRQVTHPCWVSMTSWVKWGWRTAPAPWDLLRVGSETFYAKEHGTLLWRALRKYWTFPLPFSREKQFTLLSLLEELGLCCLKLHGSVSFQSPFLPFFLTQDFSSPKFWALCDMGNEQIVKCVRKGHYIWKVLGEGSLGKIKWGEG